jgi:hypothetical protein
MPVAGDIRVASLAWAVSSSREAPDSAGRPNPRGAPRKRLRCRSRYSRPQLSYRLIGAGSNVGAAGHADRAKNYGAISYLPRRVDRNAPRRACWRSGLHEEYWVLDGRSVGVGGVAALGVGADDEPNVGCGGLVKVAVPAPDADVAGRFVGNQSTGKTEQQGANAEVVSRALPTQPARGGRVVGAELRFECDVRSSRRSQPPRARQSSRRGGSSRRPVRGGNQVPIRGEHLRQRHRDRIGRSAQGHVLGQPSLCGNG